MCLEDFLGYMSRTIAGQVPERKTEDDLSKEFKKFLQDSFRWYDKDGDGFITKSELKVSCHLLPNVSNDEMKYLLVCVNNRNGDAFDAAIYASFLSKPHMPQ